MRRTLRPHPDCVAPELQIEVEALRGRTGIELRYKAEGALDRVVIPPQAPPARAHRLWEHTCFELFVRLPQDGAYHEFNFSPSGEWAAYRLAGYRKGMADAEIRPPSVVMRQTDRALELDVDLDLTGLDHSAPESWQVGLSVIIEDVAGARSFWALDHPPGEPDFHHPACFALELPAPERS